MSAAAVERNSVTVEPTHRDRLAVAAWALTTTIALAVLALIIAAPLTQSGNHAGFASAIYQAFSFVCHQIPERSFHIAGHQFAVCSRCTGLYAGFALAASIYPLARSLKRSDTPRRIWLVLAAVPLLIDFALGYFSIWENTQLSRFLTGALLSSVAVFYVVPGLIELSNMIAGRLAHRKNN